MHQHSACTCAFQHFCLSSTFDLGGFNYTAFFFISGSSLPQLPEGNTRDGLQYHRLPLLICLLPDLPVAFNGRGAEEMEMKMKMNNSRTPSHRSLTFYNLWWVFHLRYIRIASTSFGFRISVPYCQMRM